MTLMRAMGGPTEVPRASTSAHRWGKALAEVVRGADFASSPLAPFAVDRSPRGEGIRDEHGYEWGSFA